MNSSTSTAFTLVSQSSIDSLGLRYEEYQHRDTGAKHIHLGAENKENVFLVALRTVPTDSTGVAHILEHTSLCGSEKYPVRDPFFMMSRRSLNTFMNAFTSSDWTAYPFASQSRKDFDNLLQVYLDAVFFARLDPLDFAQEGHRLEFEPADDVNGELVYKGVVFNEMKGAMSSISSQLWQAVGEALFPDTTYHFNSGGEPVEIPKLSYQQLRAFYQTHYHPDNAIFVTYGDIPAAEHQRSFESLALSRFAHEKIVLDVPLQKPFTEPVRLATPYALAEGEALESNCHRVMAWVLGDIRDPMEVMTAHLLSSMLLEDSASPLQQALETTSLGRAPSPLCGLDDTSLQMVFVCGLEGCDESELDEFEKLVLDTLQQTAASGIAEQRLVALLDQLELQQREISGDGYPYGLQLILACLPSAVHRGKADAMLDIDPVLAKLREQIKDPDFTRSILQRLLLDNTHRATVTLTPDAELNRKRSDAEAAELAARKAALDAQSKNEIIETAKALAERQLAEDDPETLPRVTVDDVPDMPAPPACTVQRIGTHKLTFYPQATNGIVYQQAICPLPALQNKELVMLGVHNRLLTEVGAGKLDYLQMQDLQTKVCGGISAFSSMRGELDDEQQLRAYFTLSAKGLAGRSEALADLMAQTYADARFDETQRIAEMISRYSARAQQSVTGSGHALAMSAACQGMSPLAKLSHNNSGLAGIKQLKALDKSLAESSGRNAISQQLTELHEKMLANSVEFLGIGAEDMAARIGAAVKQAWAHDEQSNAQSTLALQPVRERARELWVCNSQVNFCAKAYPTVPAGHPDAAALTVLGGVLRNGFLHTAVREQGGAYGGGASQDSGNAAFRFYSYRDPRLLETLNDFDRAIEWLLNTNHEWRAVEEAILGVVSTLDKPASPAGTAKQHFHEQLFGRTPERQAAFRDAILAVREADLKRVASEYLDPADASIGIITHKGEESNYAALCERETIAIERL
ncbi:MAG: insulinase family protein [Gammaproteobacteria bacterium]|nr:insulinase family protein [Gammaproteobacteria bacterium]